MRHLFRICLLVLLFSATWTGSGSAAIKAPPLGGPVLDTLPKLVVSMAMLPTNDTGTYSANFTLISGKPVDMMVRPDPTFAGATFRSYSNPIYLNISDSDGLKPMYARFRDANGTVSDTATAGVVLGHLDSPGAQQTFAYTPTSSGDFSLQSAHFTTDFTTEILDAANGQSLVKSAAGSVALTAPMIAQRTYTLRVTGPSTYPYALTYQFSPVDHDPPTVTITLPASAGTYSGTVALQAAAQDSGGIPKVEWLLDNALIATATASPYRASWDTTKTTNGTHTLTARAYDTIGNVGTANLTVTVSNDGIPPTIQVTPLPPMVITRTIPLQFTAQDDQPGPVSIKVSNQSDLADATWQPTTPTLNWSLTPGDGPKTLYVQARDQAGNTTPPTALTTVLDTQHEPNDSQGQAADAPLGPDLTGRIAIATDVDFYRVTSTTTGWLSLALRGAVPSLQVIGDGQSLCDKAPCNIHAESGKTYYIRLYGAAQPTADYHLQVTLTAAADHSTPATALDLPAGGVDAALEGPGDRDMYRIQAASSGTLQIQLAAPASLGATYTLLNSQGLPLDRLPDGSYAVTQGTTYYVLVQGSGWSTTDTYHLSTTLQAAAPTTPCLTTDTALPLQLGGQTASMPADALTCYFRYTPGENGVLSIRMDSGSKQDLDLQLQDSSAHVLSSSTSGLGLPDTIEYRLQAGQTYFVGVQYYAGSRGTFGLQTAMTPTPQALDPYEPNETLLTATPLLSGSITRARIDNPADVDTFLFTPTQAGNLTVDLATQADTDLDITIRTSSGTVLAKSSNGLGLAERINLPITMGQALYLTVFYYSGAVPAAYRLQLTFTPGSGSTASGEPNETLAQGTPVTSAETYGEITNATDIDVYRWQAPSTAIATWTLTMPAKTDLDFEIVDASGGVIAASRKGLGMAETCAFPAASGTVYYLRILYYSGTTPAPYTLNQVQP